MSVLNFVRNKRAVLKLSRRWPSNLPPPVLAADNEALMRAVSLLVNMPTQDGERVSSGDMQPSHARDVVACFG